MVPARALYIDPRGRSRLSPDEHWYALHDLQRTNGLLISGASRTGKAAKLIDLYARLKLSESVTRVPDRIEA